TPIPSEVLQNLLTFESVFCFEDRVKSLEVNFLEFIRTNQSPEAVSNILANLLEMELKKILIDKMEGNKSTQEDVRMMMIKKDPPLDQTGGLKDEEKLGSMHQPALHLNQLPRVQASLLQGLNLDRCLPVQKINPLFKLLSIRSGSPSQGNHQHRIPLPLIPDNRGRRVIPFEHFINNDLEYLWGGASSQKYTTSMTKTKVADYGHIKWIEDLVPRTMWIQEPLNKNKHALWGVSHWGQKRQQFYGFAVNRESALDVYSKRRIIAVTDLKIVEGHNYKHLDWISVRRDDEKIYKFKEGEFKRLRLQDIEDMLLLLV
nr:hypothetical protein [Tanacetum cinerariifolium]